MWIFFMLWLAGAARAQAPATANPATAPNPRPVSSSPVSTPPVISPQTNPAPANPASVPDSSGDVARLVVGFEKSAAVSADPVEKIFSDFYFDRAFSASGRMRAWGDVRIESLPVTISSTVLTAPLDIGKAVTATPLDQLVQSGDFLAGAEYRVSNPGGGRASVSLTGAYGAAAPLSSDPSRQNFYRQFFGGVRIAGAGGGQQLDLGIGQDEAVTDGRLHGMALRFDTFYALPVPGAGFIYLYGTALVKASGAGASRDLYRVGMGIDFVQLLRSLGGH